MPRDSMDNAVSAIVVVAGLIAIISIAVPIIFLLAVPAGVLGK